MKGGSNTTTNHGRLLNRPFMQNNNTHARENSNDLSDHKISTRRHMMVPNMASRPTNNRTWDDDAVSQGIKSIREENKGLLEFDRARTILPEERMEYYEKAVNFHKINIPFGRDTEGQRNRMDDGITQRLHVVVNLDFRKAAVMKRIKELSAIKEQEMRYLEQENIDRPEGYKILIQQFSKNRETFQKNNEMLARLVQELNVIAKDLTFSYLTEQQKNNLRLEYKELRGSMAAIQRNQARLGVVIEKDTALMAKRKGIALTKHFQEKKAKLKDINEHISAEKHTLHTLSDKQNKIIEELEQIAIIKAQPASAKREVHQYHAPVFSKKYYENEQAMAKAQRHQVRDAMTNISRLKNNNGSSYYR